MSSFKKDTLFTEQHLDQFIFDERVVDVFPDMINRSVPGYPLIIKQIGMLAQRYAQDNTVIYDLGCSLGAATFSMRHSVKAQVSKIVAVDTSSSMIERFHHHLDRDVAVIPVEPIESDIENISLENSSVTVLNFTLQFIKPEKRESIITNIYNGLVDDGVLILSEKLKFNENDHDDHLLDELYLDFKRFNGYSEMEISRKREALENVLMRDSLDDHKKRLQQAGFSKVHVWFQCFNFVSILAQK